MKIGADPNSFTSRLKATMALRGLGLLKIPLIFFVSPSVLELTEKRSVIKIPLLYRSKNHLGSMYFGALAIGADCAGGFLAQKIIMDSGRNVSLVFKDFHAQFLKRPEHHVHFVCEDGELLQRLVDKAIQTKERVDDKIQIKAMVPKKLGDEPAAIFDLTISIKIKS